MNYLKINGNNPKLIWKLRLPSKSIPGSFHLVEIYDSGDMRCDCMAYEMGKECNHIKKMKQYLRDLVKKF